jgi:lipopolysaccharide/colanic/teichoic acid biosynthesis glycosyltransferase
MIAPGQSPAYLAVGGAGLVVEEARAGGCPAWKRAVDVALALALLVGTAPVLLVALVLTRLTSRGPALYAQVRQGFDGRLFTLYKVRTMTHDCERRTGPCWSLPGDPRVTPLGRWLRRTKIDELPQLWNVLAGEMSLIGPRPERPEIAANLERHVLGYRERLRVLPGLSGLAQVQLPPDTDLASVRLKLAYDLHYVRTVSFWLDLRIGWATACKMVGVPFRLLKKIFGFTARETIEAGYEALVRSRSKLMTAVKPTVPATAS